MTVNRVMCRGGEKARREQVQRIAVSKNGKKTIARQSLLLQCMVEMVSMRGKTDKM